MTSMLPLTAARHAALRVALRTVGGEFHTASWNGYSSTFDSFVLTGDGLSLFAKFGESYSDPFTNHRRGIAHEIEFYEMAALSTRLLPRLIANGVTDEGEDFLVLEHLDAARLEHDTNLNSIEGAISALAALHGTLDAATVPRHVNRFDNAFFDPWIERAIQARAVWSEKFSWVDGLAEQLSQIASSAAGGGVINGELFASNVLICRSGTPKFVDWDAWGWGPRALDLAALTLGWPGISPAQCCDIYQSARAVSGSVAVVDLLRARLLYAYMTLTWRARKGLPISRSEPWAQDAKRSSQTLKTLDRRRGLLL